MKQIALQRARDDARAGSRGSTSSPFVFSPVKIHGEWSHVQATPRRIESIESDRPSEQSAKVSLSPCFSAKNERGTSDYRQAGTRYFSNPYFNVNIDLF